MARTSNYEGLYSIRGRRNEEDPYAIPEFDEPTGPPDRTLGEFRFQDRMAAKSARSAASAARQAARAASPLINPLNAAATGLSAVSSLAQGVGGALAARQLFTDADADRLGNLTARQRRGDLGLTSAQRSSLTAASQAEQAGMSREANAEGLRRAAAAGLGSGGYNMRDIFLSEQAAAEGKQAAKRATAQEITARDLAAADAQRQEIAQLRAQRAQRKAQTQQALLGGVAGALGAGASGVIRREETAMRQAEMGKISTEDLLRMLQGGTGAASSYSKRL